MARRQFPTRLAHSFTTLDNGSTLALAMPSDWRDTLNQRQIRPQVVRQTILGGTEFPEALTIWEYLLLDKIGAEATRQILSATENPSNRLDLVQVRVLGEIDEWTEGRNIGGIQKRILYENDDFPNRTARCRRDLNLSRFNLQAESAMADFKSDYIGELFSSLLKSKGRSSDADLLD